MGAERTPKDYAIEFAEYMAKSVEHYMLINDTLYATQDDKTDARRHLTSAVYEFRKRAQTSWRVRVSEQPLSTEQLLARIKELEAQYCSGEITRGLIC